MFWKRKVAWKPPADIKTSRNERNRGLRYSASGWLKVMDGNQRLGDARQGRGQEHC